MATRRIRSIVIQAGSTGQVGDIDHTIPFNHANPKAGGLTVPWKVRCLCRLGPYRRNRRARASIPDVEMAGVRLGDSCHFVRYGRRHMVDRTAEWSVIATCPLRSRQRLGLFHPVSLWLWPTATATEFP